MSMKLIFTYETIIMTESVQDLQTALDAVFSFVNSGIWN